MTRYTPHIFTKDEPEHEVVKDICLYCTLRERVTGGMIIAFIVAAIQVVSAISLATTDGTDRLSDIVWNVVVFIVAWFFAWRDYDLRQTLVAMNRPELHPPYSKGEPGYWAEEQRDHAISMLIERWHNLGGQDHTAFSLPTWMGWSHEEYAHWVETNEPPIPKD